MALGTTDHTDINKDTTQDNNTASQGTPTTLVDTTGLPILWLQVAITTTSLKLEASDQQLLESSVQGQDF